MRDEVNLFATVSRPEIGRRERVVPYPPFRLPEDHFPLLTLLEKMALTDRLLGSWESPFSYPCQDISSARDGLEGYGI